MEASLAVEGGSRDAQNGTELEGFEDDDEPPSRTPSAREEVRTAPSDLESHYNRGLYATLKSVLTHSRDLVFSEHISVLLVFVPIGIAVGFSDVDPILDFILNALGIIPLAVVISTATESLANRLGDTLGALLNVTVGNTAELMMIFAALSKDQIQIVQASLLGSVLMNLLLVLGTAFLAGGLKYAHHLRDVPAGRVSITLMDFGVLTSVFPVAFLSQAYKGRNGPITPRVLDLSRATSFVLIFVYGLYLRSQMKVRDKIAGLEFADTETNGVDSFAMVDIGNARRLDRQSSHTRQYDLVSTPPRLSKLLSLRLSSFRWSLPLSTAIRQAKHQRGTEEAHNALLRPSHSFDEADSSSEDGDNTEWPISVPKSGTARGGAQIMGSYTNSPSSEPPAGTSLNHSYISLSPHRGLPPSPPSTIPSSPPAEVSRLERISNDWDLSYSSQSSDHRQHRRQNTLRYLHDHKKQQASTSQVPLAVVFPILILSTGIVSICTELAVDAIPSLVDSWKISQIFLGLIVLPIVGNAAEHVTAFKLAMRNRMALAKSVAVESSTQIVLCITPTVVLLGWARSRAMSLQFDLFEIGSVLTTTFVVSIIIFYGKSGVKQGAFLITVYIIIAFGALFDSGYIDTS